MHSPQGGCVAASKHCPLWAPPPQFPFNWFAMMPSFGNLLLSFSHQVTPGSGNTDGGTFFPRVLGVRHPTLHRPPLAAQPSPWRCTARGDGERKAEAPERPSLGLSAGANETLGWPNTTRLPCSSAQPAAACKQQEASGQPPAALSRGHPARACWACARVRGGPQGVTETAGPWRHAAKNPVSLPSNSQ